MGPLATSITEGGTIFRHLSINAAVESGTIGAVVPDFVTVTATFARAVLGGVGKAGAVFAGEAMIDPFGIFEGVYLVADVDESGEGFADVSVWELSRRAVFESDTSEDLAASLWTVLHSMVYNIP